ncbi:MAG: alpha/beta hydrolase [Acidobacteria bacterium]|nr:MAG: alpha/beta hydrolase [Acidobacteriota bacterium]
MSKLRLGGIQIGYDDQGNGPALVLLHGYPFNRSQWRDQLTTFNQSYRVISPDLRGHGETDVTATTIQGMAQDVAELMTALDVPTAIIGGLSMGGYVALSFYRQFPDRVKALVLADTRASADTETARQNRAIQAERALREGMPGIADEMVPKLLGPETLANNPELVQRLRQMMVNTNPKGANGALKAMSTREDQTSFLSQITTPTLIVVGREDAITPVADSELMNREIKGSRLEVIEDSGHVSNLEQPEEFDMRLREFLSSLSA